MSKDRPTVIPGEPPKTEAPAPEVTTPAPDALAPSADVAVPAMPSAEQVAALIAQNQALMAELKARDRANLPQTPTARVLPNQKEAQARAREVGKFVESVDGWIGPPSIKPAAAK